MSAAELTLYIIVSFANRDNLVFVASRARAFKAQNRDNYSLKYWIH
jgi:hypothetical protein